MLRLKVRNVGAVCRFVVLLLVRGRDESDFDLIQEKWIESRETSLPLLLFLSRISSVRCSVVL